MKPPEHTWPQYVRNGLGRHLSRVGEHLGINALTYNPVIMETFHAYALQNAAPVVAAMREVFPSVKSVTDVGCGSGAFAAEFLRHGITARGLEHSRHGIAMARAQGVACDYFDVAQPPRGLRPTELAYSFEVAEHLPAALSEAFVRLLVQLAPLILFTAAQPGQGGIGHINEQPLAYWIEVFSRAGCIYCAEETDRVRAQFQIRETSYWFPANALVFRAGGAQCGHSL